MNDNDFLIKEIEKKIKYIFTNKKILLDILLKQDTKYKQRLEFLGDALINSVITQYIFKHHKKKKAGFLSQLRAYLVSNMMQYKIVYAFDLIKYIDIQNRQQVQNKLNKSVSNFLEVLIGGVFLDCNDIDIVGQIILFLWAKFFNSYEKSSFNAKSDLQKYCHDHNIDMPQYVFEKIGLNDGFKVKLNILEHEVCTESRNKKEGEKECAVLMLDLLRNT